MPKVIGNDSLIARVNEVEGCMYRQSNELGRLNRAVKKYKDENAKLREQIERLHPKDYEGNELDIADAVHMLRSEYDGDHEWDDVVVELVLTKWGGDRWIVRGSKGEAWACDCLKTGHDEDAYERSDDAELVENPTLIEVENAKLREFSKFTWRAIAYEVPLSVLMCIAANARELGIEVEDE